MICPLFLLTIPGTMSLVIYRRPLILVSIIVSQSSISPSYSASSPRARPALLINTSISAQSSGSESIAFWTASLSRTSKTSGNVSMFGQRERISFSAAPTFSLVLPVRIISYPPCANLTAQAFPMPLVAPVIKTVLFILSKFMKKSLYFCLLL